MKNLTKILLSMYVVIMMIMVACKKDEPTPTPPVTTPTTTPPVVTKSSTKDITKFSFAALSPVVDATIDATAKTISATVPAATDLTKLVPTITLSDKATVSPASGVATDFSKEVSYTVTAEDASTVVWKVNVVKAVVAQSCQLTGLTVTYNNGTLSENFEYDTEKRLIKRTSKNTQQSLDATIIYSYDKDGFLTESVWERINSKSNNGKRVTTYTYKNGRLNQENIKETNSGGTKTGVATYEYESETSDKIKKIVFYDFQTGYKDPYIYLFTNGILSSITDPPILLKTYTINNKGLVEKGYRSGSLAEEFEYDSDGQQIKSTSYNNGSMGGIAEYTYTKVKNKYDNFEDLVGGQYFSSQPWLASQSGTVFNPEGFKGFPSFRAGSRFFKETNKYLLQTRTYKGRPTDPAEITTWDYKTDANGNVISFTNEMKQTGYPTYTFNGTLTYKCN